MEHFLEDNNLCIYFPRKRYLKKMMNLKGKTKLTKEIETVVNNLRFQEKKHAETKIDLCETNFNVIVGAIVIEGLDQNHIQTIPIEKQKEKEAANYIDLEITFECIKRSFKKKEENYNKKYEELEKLEKINISNDLNEILSNLEQNLKQCKEFDTYETSLVIVEIKNLQEYIKNTNLYRFNNYRPTRDEWLISRAQIGMLDKIFEKIKSHCPKEP